MLDMTNRNVAFDLGEMAHKAITPTVSTHHLRGQQLEAESVSSQRTADNLVYPPP